MGRSHPPPRWALGYMGSTMVYTEADDAHFPSQIYPYGGNQFNCYGPVEGVNPDSAGAFCGTWDL